jgi:hypothetical protein
MKKADLIKMLKDDPIKAQKALKTGRLSACHRLIELPDDFEFDTKLHGLGDVVASIAQPIARVIDRVAGTDIQNCGGCKKRQEALNKAVPFKTD